MRCTVQRADGATCGQTATHSRYQRDFARIPFGMLREMLRQCCTSRVGYRQPTAIIRAASAMSDVTIPPDALNRFRIAASQFAPGTKGRASRLLAVKDDIAALRSKGASFRTISELLTQNGIAASDTCVMRFCRRVLGEKRTRNPGRKPSVAKWPIPATTHRAPVKPAMSEAAQVALLDDLLTASAPPPTPSVTEGGPRIARIEFAKPGEL